MQMRGRWAASIRPRSSTLALTGGLVMLLASTSQGQPPAIRLEDALQRQPKQAGVLVSTPPAEQWNACRLEPIINPKDGKTPMGYVVRDPAGLPLRQFVSYDQATYNIVAYYHNGVEAFREVYPTRSTDPVQYRWLGPNGSKWGLDRNRDGVIDEWVVLSPEELAQELFQAMVSRDARRAEALALNKANLDYLGMPADKAAALLERAAKVRQRVLEAAEQLKLSPQARWGHLELAAPQTVPADTWNLRDDWIVHKQALLLYHEGETARFLPLGELVLIGRAWKLLDGPMLQPVQAAAQGPVITDAIKDLVAQLNEIDQRGSQATTPEALAAHHAQRAKVLEQILAKLPEGPQQEPWLRLLIDSLGGAAETEKNDGPHLTRLRQLKESLAKGSSASLAAHAAFRLLLAENSLALRTAPPEGFAAVQDKWRKSLEEFLNTYPTSDEAPEAILRLAMALEFTPNGEAKAKEWYQVLTSRYPQHPHAVKAAGAIKRLDSVGQALTLSGPLLNNGQLFDLASLRGKAVVVYYTASWSSTLADDARKLQSLLRDYGPKGVELVVISLDQDARAAAEALATHKMPGIHLFAPGGLDQSPLATAYGILVVPHILVADKKGVVINRAAQIATLEEDLKKALQ
ncbi:MAG: redoxin domain-containing protein [Gemmataceae bacterium]|nr:redoxin domain-containing protein [Gemmataceae bacterium]MCS7269770.1 redoxin domain-containing protein [Gemmataceae bacterium]MDW8244412.1 redoxin domain-containing protein [Thermogemmata sp.]